MTVVAQYNDQPTASTKPSKPPTCPSCKSTEIEYDPSLGQSFCGVCGAVLEESAVVAELTFSETAGGASVLQGQFVSAEHGKSAAPSIFGRRVDGGARGADGKLLSESREMTIIAARRRIAQVAVALGMSEHHIDMAQRWYVLALQHQFTRGRKAGNIVAACLYIVCRQERTPHMLLDFSDVLHTSVYSLGGTFLRLVRLLNLEIPIVDPSFYVGRFASRLEFGDRTQTVANTALRVVARMKRDWIQVGRRPAGVCAAGLIIAARMHGFRRTEREVVKVVHICEATLRKRLDEFAATPSSSLTPEQFEGIWLEQEADPPAFAKAQTAIGLISSAPRKRGRRPKAAPLPGEGSFSIDQLLVLTPPSSQTTATDGKDPKKRAEEEDNLSDLSDDDADIAAAVIKDQSEIARKTAIWTELNKDYLEREAEKLNRRLEEESKAETGKKRRRKTQGAEGPAGKKAEVAAETPAEAAKQALASKRLSKKINYEALDNLLKVK